MRPRKDIPAESIPELRVELDSATRLDDYKRLLAVWLRVELGLTIDQIARATGLAPATIRCFHSRFMSNGVAALQGSGRGGRRRAYLSAPAEAQLLTDLAQESGVTGEYDVTAVKQAYEAAVGRSVPRSTIYRMLGRHGYTTPQGRSRKLARNRQDAKSR